MGRGRNKEQRVLTLSISPRRSLGVWYSLMDARRFSVEIDDGTLAGIAFGDESRSVDALFLHANGFNSSTYQSILEPLGLRAHVAALDMRGHGLTNLPADPSKLRSWHRFRDDVIAALEQIAPQGTILAGHSMGATIALLVAGKRPDLVTALVLADPVLLHPRVYFWSHMAGVVNGMRSHSPMSRRAMKRRRTFATREAAVESFTGRGAFKTWREPFLQDYVTDGLRASEDGSSFRLSCAPEWEAACYAAQRNRPWKAVSKVKCPLVVLRGSRGSTCPVGSGQRIVRMQGHAVVSEIPGTSHFIPMERPYALRDRISEFLARDVEGFQMGEEGRVRRNLNGLIGEKD